MLQIRPVSFLDIQKFFVDFQKKSQCFEMPPEQAVFYGIFLDDRLVGYYVFLGYENKDFEVNQGYLTKEARHKRLAPLCMSLVEQLAKKNGYKRIILQTHNRFTSYIQFMNGMGYQTDRIIFSKEV